MATREKLSFTLRYLTGPAAAAALAAFLTVQAESTPPPRPSPQTVLLGEMSTAARTGLLHGKLNLGDIALKTITGNQGGDKASQGAERQLLGTALSGVYASEGFTGPDTLPPPKDEADAACVIALASAATSKTVLDPGASLAYANGLLDGGSKQQAADFSTAAADCFAADLGVLEGGGTLSVPCGSFVPTTDARPSSTAVKN